jgi:phosphoenolpyruvate synthase/pyruvate phosphate dikinase
MEVMEGLKTRVFKFGNKTADGNSQMKNLLGGKGANLAEMSAIGIPVPPGFTITTEVCTEFNLLGKESVIELIKEEVEAILNDKLDFCEAFPISLILPDDKKENSEATMKTRLSDDNFNGEIEKRFENFIKKIS